MIDYQGKSVIVTGAASGIGAALATALAQRGARVFCVDREEEGARQTAETCGVGAKAIACDLSEPEAAAGLLDQLWDRAGRVDLLCSNAGMGLGGSVADAAFDERMAQLFEVNFFAAMKFAQAYDRRLRADGGRGRLMVTASENSLSVPSAVRAGQMAFYGATKHALLVAMEWLRIEHRDGPLDLHVLMPGAVFTPLVSRLLPDPALAPPELELIMPAQCAEIALRGMDLGLFYVPTQAHLLEDMQPRARAIEHALKALKIQLTY